MQKQKIQKIPLHEFQMPLQYKRVKMNDRIKYTIDKLIKNIKNRIMLSWTTIDHVDGFKQQEDIRFLESIKLAGRDIPKDTKISNPSLTERLGCRTSSSGSNTISPKQT
eukprot:TRINITY_DN1133_c0_g1_i4.p4 TRINITY_DN1133_c0_g1~~TRINITY_DN1133_c0_g1_i4.p4  ORF type:complete len:109 (+),score=3.54 TRINITY_DN1133_c0_g1_i4:470-796(+)